MPLSLGAYEHCDGVNPAVFSRHATQVSLLLFDAPSADDWEGDRRPRHAWADTVLYETHLRGFAVYPSATVEWPGIFSGLIEKIPYLQELGICRINAGAGVFFQDDASITNM